MTTRRTSGARALVVPAVAIACLLVGCESPLGGSTGMKGDYYDLGGFHRQVATDAPEAQRWFDRGFTLCYGFNHEEAIRCFERALEADPACAMAHWGIAYALGPNINNMEMMPETTQRAVAAARAAAEHVGDDPVEQGLVDAIRRRYRLPAPADRAGLDVAYANAMRELYRAHGADADVAALFAESLMILRPWNHWSKDGVPAVETPEIVATLESGLDAAPDHPGLCHFYIHVMEASPQPERALPYADNLRNRVPGSGHLVHMPSHIDVLLGHYDDAVVANQKAVRVDHQFVKREGRHNFYTFYRIHNYHFIVYAAMFDGRSALALRTSRELVEEIPEDMLREMPDFLDAFVPTPLHVLVRFGRWEDILDEPEPPAGLPVTRSIYHYARGLAYAATGRVEQAVAEHRAFAAARASVPETSILFNNTSRDILGVADQMLAGEIAYRRGDYDLAFAHLDEAVDRDDALNYDEPWGWMQPARHALGALLLERNLVAEAEVVYRADLERHPDNPWALHGLAECLRRQGQAEEALACRARFDRAAARTDVKIRASCYCRLDVMP
ncbi:MAG: tetratricopeptide repeat protein [Planctomycetota bacterium]|jgi:tetratricopeptide (TPR) repeat protein